MTTLKHIKSRLQETKNNVAQLETDMENQINQINIQDVIKDNLKLNVEYVNQNEELQESLYAVEELYRLKIDWTKRQLERIDAEIEYVNSHKAFNHDDATDRELVSIKKARLALEKKENALELKVWSQEYDKVNAILESRGSGIKKRKKKKIKKRKTKRKKKGKHKDKHKRKSITITNAV